MCEVKEITLKWNKFGRQQGGGGDGNEKRVQREPQCYQHYWSGENGVTHKEDMATDVDLGQQCGILNPMIGNFKLICWATGKLVKRSYEGENEIKTKRQGEMILVTAF